MRSPCCKAKTKILNTRHKEIHNVTYRRHCCLKCNKRFSTIEKIETLYRGNANNASIISLLTKKD